MYEIVDESLKIACCGINDLTLGQASHFLSQWEDGAKLGSLTLFFDPKTNYLVINRDNPDYEFYLELAKGYRNVSGKDKKTYREKFGRRHRETFQVIDNFMVHSHVQSDLEMIEHQSLAAPSNKVAKSVLQRLEERKLPTYFLISQALSYGLIKVKSMERSKRKVGVA